MGSRPLRMKVRWGCPPQVLSPPPHRTQSWRPCLPGQPWASGWRSTDRPVPSPRGWMIGFSTFSKKEQLRTTSDESHGAVPREGDVHHGGPGAPSLAQPGRDERRRQGTLSRRPHLPGRAVRRHRRGLRPAVLGGTAADRGDPAHPAPAWCTIHRCPRGQASVCPSPWAPSCVLQSCSAPGRIDT